MKFLTSIFWVLGLLGSISLSAQVEVVNDGILYIEDDQLVHIQGDFSNFSSDFFNRGTFGLTGNLINEARVFNSGAGIFHLYGNQEQNIFLYQDFGTYDLGIDNSVGVNILGSSSFQLFNHLYFWNGLVNTNSEAMIDFEPLATYSFASNFSHINGPMRRLGSTDFTFPVGKGGLLRAPSITDLEGLTKFQVEYFDQGHPNLTTDNTLARVNDQEYWEIRQVEGFSVGRVTIPYDESSGVFPDLQEVEMAFLDNDRWTKVDAESDGASPMMGITSINLLSQFRYFTTAENRILREQVLLTAEQNEDCEIVASWVVPPGFTSLRYEVERSFDSLTFMKIGEVPGDTIPTLDYLIQWFVDPSLYEEEKIYYRLKIHFEDETTAYTNIVGVENFCIFEDCVLFPNPVSSSSNIGLRMEREVDQLLRIQVWSTLGRLLMDTDLEIKAGRHDYEILTKRLQLPAATYYLTLGDRKTLKFVVIND